MASTDKGLQLTGIALGWLLGVAWHLQQRELFDALTYLLASLGGACCLALAWRVSRLRWLAFVGALALGLGASGWRASARWAHELPPALEGRDLIVTGVIASLPQTSVDGVRFRFEVEQARLADGADVTVPPLLSLGWYKGFHEDALARQPQRQLRAGQRWQFGTRLRQPHGNMNPHGFDYELYLFEQGVRATGYVRDSGQSPPRLLDERAGHPVERLRQSVREAIYARVSEPRAAGVMAALSVGDQSAIDRDDWLLFRNVGIAHLVSLSGVHVTMFAWLAGAALLWAWRRSRRLMLWVPGPVAARWGGLSASLAYALFSGWGVPAQRTVWMLAAVTLLQARGRRWPWSLVLLSAAVVVSAMDPWALLQPGFWLSFVAVGLLLASEPARHAEVQAPEAEVLAEAGGDRAPRWQRWLGSLRSGAWGGLRTQIIATLGLTPLSLVFFQQVSIVGFAANLVAIPLVTLVITPLALLGVALPPLWNLGAVVIGWMSTGLQWLADWPWAVWTVPVAPVWAQIAGLAGAALLIMPLPWRLRGLAVPLVLPLLVPSHELPAQGHFELLAVDVGQGSSVLVRTRNHLMVYDTGPQYSRDSDAGQRVLVPLLRARGETRIDKLVLSHRDIDHVGGAKALLQSLPVDELLSSLEGEHPLRAMNPAPRRCESGQAWQWDGVRFEVLHPAAADYQRSLKPNALSCVLRVSSVQGSVLLAGDIERPQELALVAALGSALRSDVLLVPHHGSRTSSTEAFLDAVAPHDAVIQAGYLNRFGHPVAEVRQRLLDHGAALHESTRCGAWHGSGEGAGDAPLPGGLCERERARRYWHHRQQLVASPVEVGQVHRDDVHAVSSTVE